MYRQRALMGRQSLMASYVLGLAPIDATKTERLRLIVPLSEVRYAEAAGALLLDHHDY
jgi:hypothetical protein